MGECIFVIAIPRDLESLLRRVGPVVVGDILRCSALRSRSCETEQESTPADGEKTHGGGRAANGDLSSGPRKIINRTNAQHNAKAKDALYNNAHAVVGTQTYNTQRPSTEHTGIPEQKQYLMLGRAMAPLRRSCVLRQQP